MLGIRIEDKGPIAAFRWRGILGEDASLARLLGVAEAAGARRSAGAQCAGGAAARLPIEKGQSVADLAGASQPDVALFGGNDVTAFDALEALAADGRLGGALRVRMRSEEGPRDIVRRADLLVGGVEGFPRVLEGLLRAAR
jgi:trehalose 6-phosphate phosphatase